MEKKKSRKDVVAEDNSKKRKVIAPTVQDILQDDLTKISLENWSSFGSASDQKKLKPFNSQLVSDIYLKELQKFDPHKLMILEFSHYLEKYDLLTPNHLVTCGKISILPAAFPTLCLSC